MSYQALVEEWEQLRAFIGRLGPPWGETRAVLNELDKILDDGASSDGGSARRYWATPPPIFRELRRDLRRGS
jgi:hypothetical protein